MKIIFKCKFGSHLYGTNTEKSDLDFKGVFLPDAKDLIMQQASKTINIKTKKGSDTKNTSDDVDTEFVSIQQFIKLLIEGQTMALDMLFCPKELILEQTEEWITLQKKCKEHLLHSGTSAFVGYTRQQAAKYGVKGFRVSALREILDYLNRFQDNVTLEVLTLDSLPRNENINIIQLQTKMGLETYLEVCNRKVPLTVTIKYAKEVYKKIFDRYGERALKAEKNEGIDWKALSHAVRVANEAIELLTTGKIIFPRPEKDLLLKIKTGQMEYKEVEKIIEEGLVRVEEAQKNSILPNKPDKRLADKLIFDLHLKQIITNQN